MLSLVRMGRWLRCLLLLGLASHGAGCKPPAEPEAKPQRTITVAEARTLVVRKYNHLFADKLLPLASGNAALTPLAEENLNVVIEKDDAWILKADPLIGIIASARVSKDGQWVEINDAGFADQ